MIIMLTKNKIPFVNENLNNEKSIKNTLSNKRIGFLVVTNNQGS